MAASPNETQEHGYPRPDKNLAAPNLAAARDRVIGPERSPSFRFNVSPSPSIGYPVDRSPTLQPIYRSALIQERRRRPFPNYNTPAATTTGSSPGKVLTCLVCASLVVLFSVALIGIPITVFFVFGPRAPTFSVEKVSVYYPIFYESSTSFSSMMNITLKVNNPANRVGLWYEQDNSNSIVASYSGIRLSSGAIPPSFHLPNQDLFIDTSLTGLGVAVSDDVKHRLESDHKNRRVTLTLDMMIMVRYKMGSLTPRALLKASCDLVLDSLLPKNTTPEIFSVICDSSAGFWFAAIRN